MVWLRHLCSGGAAYVAAVAHSVRDLPCSDGTSCVTASPPVCQRHLPCGGGTSRAAAAPPMRRGHLPCGGSTLGKLLLWQKHFWCTSGSAEVRLVLFRFSESIFGAPPVWLKQFRCISGLGRALPVWRKHFRFGGSTSGLEEALLV